MKKRVPWTCNFCGSKLMYYAAISFTPSVQRQLTYHACLKGNETFKVQKCENPDCNRTFIFIEPQSNVKEQSRGNKNEQ